VFYFCTDIELNHYFKERLQKTAIYENLSPNQVFKVAEDRKDY
jgi:uncharacterized protein